MATWPVDLPQEFLMSSYAEALAENLIADGFEAKPPALRRRSTAGPFPVQGAMVMTTAEWDALVTFFGTDLSDGVLRFDFPPQGCPEASDYWIARFTAPPARSRMGNDWSVSLALEVLGLTEAPDSPSAISDDALLTEGGDELLTEDGDTIVVEA